MTRLIFLCTGNAARSVMATVMARDRAPWLDVRGAGTLSIPGLPMSQRTRMALKALELHDPDHRSHQLEASDTEWADLIVAFEPEHIGYVRRNHPEAAAITGTFPRLLRHLGSESGPLDERVAQLSLAEVEIEPWEEVVDPAGGEQDIFHACAGAISDMVDSLIPLLGRPLS